MESMSEVSTPKCERLSQPGFPAPSWAFMDVAWEGTRIPKDTEFADSEPFGGALAPKSQDHGYRAP